jgi:hypothetical protein
LGFGGTWNWRKEKKWYGGARRNGMWAGLFNGCLCSVHKFYLCIITSPSYQCVYKNDFLYTHFMVCNFGTYLNMNSILFLFGIYNTIFVNNFFLVIIILLAKCISRFFKFYVCNKYVRLLSFIFVTDKLFKFFK